MAKTVSKEVPVAERIIDFTKEEFIEDLVITDGSDILTYEEGFPIVIYQCDETSCLAEGIKPEEKLNGFVSNITVATAISGKRISVDSEEITEKTSDFDTVVYYEDPYGVYRTIMERDIRRFLLQKPDLVVSEEGVLVFFTRDHILATVDFHQYEWLMWKDMAKDVMADIESIQVYKEFCEVLIRNEKDVYDDFGRVTKIAPRQVLHLNFDLNVASHNMIRSKLTKAQNA